VVLTRHPKRTRLRQLVPSAFVVTMIVAAIAALFGGMMMLPLALVAGSYLAVLLAASASVASKHGWRHFWRLPFAFAAMHIAYGVGFLSGLLRRGMGQAVARPREAEAP
jgi:hypothetical protein